jgi:hypothetical protein
MEELESSKTPQCIHVRGIDVPGLVRRRVFGGTGEQHRRRPYVLGDDLGSVRFVLMVWMGEFAALISVGRSIDPFACSMQIGYELETVCSTEVG